MTTSNEITGKLCLITGANRGIGKEAAAQLAERGAELVLVSRDRKRGEDAAAKIGQRAKSDRVHLLVGDLSSLADVRAVAAEFKQRFDRLDILINNAAIVPNERRETVDGFEMQFAVNHLAPFLLTHLLLDRLVMASDGRIIVVSSRAHYRGKINFHDLQSTRGYGRWEAYNQSKLANIMFTYELARRLEGSNVTVNTLHPGVIGTGLLNDLVRVPGWLSGLAGLVTGSVEDGADTIVFLATDDAVAGVSGKYFVNRKEKATSKQSHDRAARRRLWQISERLVGLAHRTENDR